MRQQFIWLSQANYPQYQKSYHTVFAEKEGYSYAIVEFKKKHFFIKKIKEVIVNIFADTKYLLTVNGETLGVGPTLPGGDYGITEPLPVQYYNTYCLKDVGETLDFYIKVQLQPEVMCEVSCGRGGLWVGYTVNYEDGTQEVFVTDDTWQCRIASEAVGEKELDFTIPENCWKKAQIVSGVWNLDAGGEAACAHEQEAMRIANVRLIKSPLKNLEEIRILPREVRHTGEKSLSIDFEKIYAGYVCIEIRAEDKFTIQMDVCESEHSNSVPYQIKGNGNTAFRLMRMNSVGELHITWEGEVEFAQIYLMYSHYPIALEGTFECSDNMLGQIYELGRHTTDICRQSIELDSPKHQENLGCTGDYTIESLIAYYCFGDYSLSAMDIIRTSESMRIADGKMFHTTYSLIWVSMLYDYYMYSGDKDIFNRTIDVLDMLMRRFSSYLGDNGVLEHAPDYMFVDWVEVDEFTMHHPPKVLGQTVLNAFYYNALKCAEKIYAASGQDEKAQNCSLQAASLKTAFQECFYDKEKKLYIGGLQTPGDSNRWMPENVDRCYYTKHANTLAVLYGLCEGEEAVELMERTLTDPELIDVQPYFMHYVLEAVYKTGLFEKYGLSEIHKWDRLVEECNKGMKEAWGNDCQGYGYDHSHAWGATPSYQLPSKIAGLKIIEPGFRKISLHPDLFGLKWAKINIPTPFGLIRISLGKENQIQVPEGIEVV